MHNPGIALVVALALMLLMACDSYSSGPDDEDGVLSGTYTGMVDGTAAGDPLAFVVTFTLTEYLDTVTGTFVTDAGTAGSVSGTVNGSNVTFSINQTLPCAGTFEGTGSITNAGGVLTGTYAGTSPCTGSVTASFVVNRGDI